ncbi:MAG: acyl-CoA synthetase [Microthrixaceae bacterium]
MSQLRFPGVHAEATPDRAAITMAGSGEQVTFGELDATANRLARTFASLGLEPGGHVAACMENRVEVLEVAWGAHYAGLHYTFISTRLTPEEAAFIIGDSGSKVVVLTPALGSRLMPSLAELVDDDVRFMWVGGPDEGGVEGADDLMALAAEQSGDPIPGATEGADMLYSSGTTGRPKGVQRPLSGEPLGTTAGLALLGEFLMGMSPDSVYLSPAPMYHAAPLKWSLESLALGASVVLMDRFEPEALLSAVETYGVTHAQFVPTMFVRLLKLPEEVRNRYDVSSLQALIHAAAPCPPDIKRAMMDWVGPIVNEYYAGTEGSGFCWASAEDWLSHPGTVGKPLIGVIHIVGPDGEELPVGEEGVVYFGDGPQFEYHNDPAKTAEAYHDRGWSTLGDIGRVDEDGFLYLTDRQSNMIISGGVNVYPQEAENVLASHPDVYDVAVIGVPNEDFGEEVKAVVHLMDGVEASDERAAELIAYCRERLADIKCPRSVDFTDELPRLPTGKLLKRLLKDKYWEGHGSRI